MKTFKDYVPREFDFVGIGQMKCGSTAVWSYIHQHPDVYSPPGWSEGIGFKEPNFFNVDSRPDLGLDHIFSLNKYQSWLNLLNQAPHDKLIGEFTVHYMDSLYALNNIKEHSPNAKIFAVLRDPIDRAYSQFNWNNNTKGNGTWDKDISELIENTGTDGAVNFLNKSLYAEQIENCFKVFEKENLHFIKYESFKNDNEKEVYALLEHLGLDKSKYNYQHKELQLRPYIEPLSKKHRDLLLPHCISDIERVEKLLGWDCSDWKI